METRIVDLEVRYMHQERLFEELSRAVFEQSRVIADLEGRLRALEKRSEADGEAPPQNEPPPHY